MKHDAEKDFNRDRDRLSSLLKEELPGARRDEWFTRKVLNRLPPRANPGRRLEQWVIALIFVGLGIGVTLESVHILNAQIIYVKDFLMMGLYMLSFLGLSLWILIPWVRE